MKNKIIDINTVTSDFLKAGGLKDSLPEYYLLSGIVENNLWHNQQNVLDHVIAVYSAIEDLLTFQTFNESIKNQLRAYFSETVGNFDRAQNLKIATLLHDIEKPLTNTKNSDGSINCPGHELISAARVKKYADRFALSQADYDVVEGIVRYHGFTSDFTKPVIVNGEKPEYVKIFTDTVGDVAVELCVFMLADDIGSDLKANDEAQFKNRAKVFTWLLESQIN